MSVISNVLTYLLWPYYLLVVWFLNPFWILTLRIRVTHSHGSLWIVTIWSLCGWPNLDSQGKPLIPCYPSLVLSHIPRGIYGVTCEYLDQNYQLRGRGLTQSFEITQNLYISSSGQPTNNYSKSRKLFFTGLLHEMWLEELVESCECTSYISLDFNSLKFIDQISVYRPFNPSTPTSISDRGGVVEPLGVLYLVSNCSRFF